MQNNYQDKINLALKELSIAKNVSSALLVCNALLEYMGVETKSIEDIELSKIKLPNAERYDRWFDAHPHFRGDRACFEISSKETSLEAKFFALQKRSKLFIAGSVNFTPNFEDHDFTRNDPNMRVGIDFFLTPEKDSVIVVLSNKGSLRLVELSERLTNTQNEIFTLWHDIAQLEDRNILHNTIWESFKLSSLNEKFYEGMVNSFTALTQHMQLSGTQEQHANQFANRLLGRLLFLWFLRKKHIINEEKEYFVIDADDNAYYQNKLSVLFFNVLNNESHKEADPITPYLNGGLFDQNADGEYWNAHKPTFPIGFFKTLYDHFDSFNFTTDESTPEYEQIAIDPEMLGRIFESFLATLKTETGKQAKKANGAFYTPREIVSYMSRESLRQYLYTALDANETLKSSIDDLLDRPNNEWALAGTNSKRDAVAKEDRERILKALREIKVLDPAVGSGAFPMGILHKILSVFERLEPSFDAYKEKISILKNSIYGVDIDPTAVEISRLRAWLSIIVDVKDVNKIKPLPNLEFKFVCANSLIGLDTSKQMTLEKADPNLKAELMRIRDEYYATSNKRTKEKLQKEYNKLTHPGQASMLDSVVTRQLKSYQPFENGKCASFYDPELMHGVASFDVVIGNPPYVQVGKGIYSENQFPYSEGKDKGKQNLYKVFVEHGFNLARNDGVVCFITQNSLMADISAEFTRELLLKKTIMKQIVEFPKKSKDKKSQVFESVLQGTCIVFFQKQFPKNDQSFLISAGNGKSSLGNLDAEIIFQKDLLDFYPLGKYFPLIKEGEFFVLQDIVNGKKRLKSIIAESSQGDFNLTSSKDKFSKEITPIKMYRGKHVHRFNLDADVEEYMKVGFKESGIENNQKYQYFLSQNITGTTDEYRLHFCLTDKEEKFLCGHSVNKFRLVDESQNTIILGILNSKLLDWYFRKTSTNNHVNGYEIEELPITKLDTPEQKNIGTEIATIVFKILTLKKQTKDADTKNLELQIDQLVYGLYGLTKEEIAIIENNSKS